MYITREKVLKLGALASVIMLCAAIVSVILTGINQFKLGSQLASVNQVSNLSHLLVRQQANLFGLMLLRDAPNRELVDALDNFSHEAFVIDANLYSASGKLIAKSKNALKFKALLSPNSESATQQIVEPIVSQQKLVGFLRVTFDAQYGQTTKNRVELLFGNLYGELIILFLAGGLLMSCFSKLFSRKHIVHHAPIKAPTPSNKRQTQRFHSRRRRFSA